jgi:hypothetical protein
MVFAHDDQPIGPRAFVGLIVDLGNILTDEHLVLMALEAHDAFFDSLRLASRSGGNFIAREPLKGLPSFLGSGFGQVHHLGMGIHSENASQRSNSPVRVKSVSPRRVIARPTGLPTHRERLHRCAAVQYPPAASLEQRIVGQIQHMIALMIGPTTTHEIASGHRKRKGLSARGRRCSVKAWSASALGRPSR